MRKQVYISPFGESDSETELLRTIAEKEPVAGVSQVEANSDGNPVLCDDSWVEGIDELDENTTDSNMANAIPNGHDPESLETGIKVLHELSKGKGKITLPTRVIKDIWHAFHMILISKNHGLRRVFA
jgi:hypothetical protein